MVALIIKVANNSQVSNKLVSSKYENSDHWQYRLDMLAAQTSNEPRHEKTSFFAYGKTKMQISAFVFIT